MVSEEKSKVSSFQELLEELKKRELEPIKRDITINIHIQEIKEITVHDFKLDELSYRLDRLDIKELSGALNLGNNFGGKVIKGKEKPNRPDHFSVVVCGKNIPFTVTDYYN